MLRVVWALWGAGELATVVTVGVVVWCFDLVCRVFGGRTGGGAEARSLRRVVWTASVFGG